MLIYLLKNELYKIIHLKKIYFIFCIIAGMEITYILQYKFKEPNSETIQSLAIPLLEASPQLIIIFIAILIADVIVENYQNGTTKLSLLRPISRIEYLNGKVLSLILIVMALLIFLVTFAFLLEIFVFGWGEHGAMDGIAHFTGEELWMMLKIMFFTLLPSLGYGMIVMFIALTTMNMSITISLSLSFLILSPIVDSIEQVKNYSIMYQFNFLSVHVIQNPMASETWTGLGSTLAYIGFFYMGSVMMWRKKDLLL